MADSNTGETPQTPEKAHVERVPAAQIQIGDVSDGSVAQEVGWDGDVRVIEWADAEGGRAVLRYSPTALIRVNSSSEGR